jgi:hypothetical protein
MTNPEQIYIERNSDITGIVQCKLCKRLVEVKPPTMYIVHEKLSPVLIGDMTGFGCKECFLKQSKSGKEQK